MSEAEKGAGTEVELEAQIQRLREDFAEMARLLKSLAGEKAAAAGEAVHGETEAQLRRSREAAENVRATAATAGTAIEDHIAATPVQSAVIALLIGFLLGSLSRR